MEKEEYIHRLNSFDENVSYDFSRKRIIIKRKELDHEFIENFYSNYVSFLKNNTAPDDVFVYPIIRKMKFDPFGHAFLQYATQVIDKGFKHNKTNWAMEFENIIHVTYSNDKIENLREYVLKKLSNNNKIERRFIKKIFNGYGKVISVNGWIQIIGIHPKEVNKNYYALYKWKLKNLLLPNYDRLIPMIRNMSKDGFDIKKAYSKNIDGKKNLGGLLMFSSTTHRYSFISGKHRFASLNYLIENKMESQDSKINFPVIEHPFKNWREYYSNKENTNK